MLGLGVNTRVLLIGAHPDDEDTNLIAWLSRGRHVETAYLSLTRGDGGQNVIGNELGEALGVIRTEELLAARRIDGAEQYFTRAYDFGFSKDTVDTFRHWPRDSILGDVVRVVRAFRPHVIVGVFSGTPRDGHGQHQVSGVLARLAYELAGDTVRLGSRYGEPWTPLKFYRAARGNAQAGTIGMDVGEYSLLLGESYGEIAGRSRSQHKSQGFGALQRKGPIMNYLRREATRVNESTPADREQSLFDGIDTTWARFRAVVPDDRSRLAIDSLPAAFTAVRAAFDPFDPASVLAPLQRVGRLIGAICMLPRTSDHGCQVQPPSGWVQSLDLLSSYVIARNRVDSVVALASGVVIDATAAEVWPVGERRVPVVVDIYNRNRDTITASMGMVEGVPYASRRVHRIPPNGAARDTLMGGFSSISQPWWLARERTGDLFTPLINDRADDTRSWQQVVRYRIELDGPPKRALGVSQPVVYRFADDVKGEVRRPVAGVPAIAISVDEQRRIARANTDLDSDYDVHLQSADASPRDVRVALTLPDGLRADSTSKTVRLENGAQQTVSFRVRGRLAAGEHGIAAVAESGGQKFDVGYQLIDYDHIRPQRLYRPAATTIVAVAVNVPRALRVGYVSGVSDNVAVTLAQLGIPVTVIPAADLGRANLSAFTTIVVGPRAYEAHPELVAANPRLLDFARRGGTVVVQYGQYEMTQPGIMPFPITINRPHDRVTHEDASVAILDANAPELRTPNRITEQDFAGWVQERSLYMPRTFDPRYRAMLGMNDPGEDQNRGAVLVAPFGQGVYVYTTLAFFRQLPAGVPGAARLFVNLLSARPSVSRPIP